MALCRFTSTVHQLLAIVLLTVTAYNSFLQSTYALSFSSLEESEIEATGNPHVKAFCDDQKSKGGEPEYSECSPSYCQPNLLLQPHRILHTPMKTQSDTFLGIVTKKVLSVPIPIYQFKQPRRLSELELPYEMVLVSDIDGAAGGGLIREVPVDPKMSVDSWFVGYRWSPIMCGESLHVGWKFEKIGNPTEFFYALIVSMKKKEDESVMTAASSFAEAVVDMLSIGTRAPKWMISASSLVA